MSESEINHALDQYVAAIEASRRQLMAASYIDATASTRSQSVNALLAAIAYGYNSIVAPRPTRPRFISHLMFEPNVYMMSAPNPDFSYVATFLDGRQDYRVWGNLKNFDWVVLQTAPDGPWGVPAGGVRVEERRGVRSYDFDNFIKAENGDFEIIFSADMHDGNWIEIDRASDNNFVTLRRVIYDWTADTSSELHIEPIGPARIPLGDLAPQEMAKRILKAANTLKNHVDAFILGWPRRCERPNEFVMVPGPGGLGALWGFARFKLAPDSALIVETEVPLSSKYWGVHLTDLFFSTLDYIDHQSKINAREAAKDADGKFRAVIALRDPGQCNWLDPQGNTEGTVLFRWFCSDSEPVPLIREVPLAKLADSLPAETALISPAARAERIRKHGSGILRHYGY